MNQEEYLMHYGVLGMRWGVRRAKRLDKKAKKSFAKSEKYKNKKNELVNTPQAKRHLAQITKYNAKAAETLTKAKKSERFWGEPNTRLLDKTNKYLLKSEEWQNKHYKYLSKKTEFSALEDEYRYKGEKYLKKSNKLQKKYGSI